jgi:NAD(P)H-flavin reductase
MNFKTATVISNNNPAGKFHDLVLETTESFDFKAGQFITMRINPSKLNAYSIAGKVSENRFGLLIDTTPGGLGSQKIEGLKTGDKVEFLGPTGHFQLHPDDESEEIIFLATGCGIAPIKAMIEEALKNLKMTKKMTLYFGLRFREDIFWDEYLNSLQEQYSNFKFVLCLSKPDDCWQGVCGHNTACLKEEIESFNNGSAYMCGSVRMVDEAIEILKNKGCIPERIYFEKYG